MSHADEFFDFHASEMRRARVDGKCDGCGETIAPGMYYTRYFVVDDGEPWSGRHCGRCRAIWLAIAYRTIDPVLLTLDCGETWLDTFGEAEPPEVAALAFMLPGEAEPR